MIERGAGEVTTRSASACRKTPLSLFGAVVELVDTLMQKSPVSRAGTQVRGLPVPIAVWCRRQ